MEKLNKMVLVSVLAFSLLGSTSAFANEAAVPESPEAPIITTAPDTPTPTPSPEDGGIITPMAELINQIINFDGNGQASFTYSGDWTLRFYLQNMGSSRIHVRLDFPGGNNLAQFDLNAGEANTFNFPLYDIYGPGAWGTYNVYVHNDDGSQGKFWLAARTIKE
ncbi:MULTISPECIES: hypothetical protein [unclassified Paenibacillus]|uniref:hypothetical protein n=1 Tax=unclassified Paenibacillus TaxID=185978 RepID=UPI0030FAD82E